MRLNTAKVLLAVAIIIVLLKIPISFFNPDDAVEQRIKMDIVVMGVRKATFLYLVKAPILEEAWYRILWSVPFLYIFSKPSWKRNLFYLVVVSLPTAYWAFYHPYPLIYNGLILCGGLFSNLIILYFNQSKRWQDRLQGILIPFLAHAEVNLIIFYWVAMENNLI